MKGKKCCPLAARIKKLMQADEDVGKISQATPVLIGKAMEMFLKKLCEKTYEVAQARQAKTVSTSHLKHFIMSEETMDFLKDIVSSAPDLTAEVEAEAPKVKRRRTEDILDASSSGQASTSSTGTGRGRGRPPGSGKNQQPPPNPAAHAVSVMQPPQPLRIPHTAPLASPTGTPVVVLNPGLVIQPGQLSSPQMPVAGTLPALQLLTPQGVPALVLVHPAQGGVPSPASAPAAPKPLTPQVSAPQHLGNVAQQEAPSSAKPPTPKAQQPAQQQQQQQSAAAATKPPQPPTPKGQQQSGTGAKPGLSLRSTHPLALNIRKPPPSPASGSKEAPAKASESKPVPLPSPASPSIPAAATALSNPQSCQQALPAAAGSASNSSSLSEDTVPCAQQQQPHAGAQHSPQHPPRQQQQKEPQQQEQQPEPQQQQIKMESPGASGVPQAAGQQQQPVPMEVEPAPHAAGKHEEDDSAVPGPELLAPLVSQASLAHFAMAGQDDYDDDYDS